MEPFSSLQGRSFCATRSARESMGMVTRGTVSMATEISAPQVPPVCREAFLCLSATDSPSCVNTFRPQMVVLDKLQRIDNLKSLTSVVAKGVITATTTARLSSVSSHT
ncbi:hypothetical protein E2C01_021163 [Portunus trituberculatus]|uniref:Uncharacterized protein n=1 Tax=Portunus trituberculatus TaxID=210409 RepID=A0A5B7E1W9_PORTR|nr:hypothetical protein [Portunus trituberculatus]